MNFVSCKLPNSTTMPSFGRCLPGSLTVVILQLGEHTDISADYNEISFVCLRPGGCLETSNTLNIICRTLAKKLDGFEGLLLPPALPPIYQSFLITTTKDYFLDS